MTIFPDFSLLQLAATGIIFIWSGFVRSGLGFGGAALGLPFMLLVYDQPIFWIPVIGSQLLFFSALTLRNRLHNVDWAYLKKAGPWILPAAIAGVYGLISLPPRFLMLCIYVITLFYAVFWALNRTIQSSNRWVDRCLLILGGYVSGATLTGAPLMIAVFMRNVTLPRLRDTLFVLWFIIVTIKLTTLFAVGVPLQLPVSVALLPMGAIGHWIGLKAHEYILQRDVLCKRLIGIMLIIVCIIGLAGLSQS